MKEERYHITLDDYEHGVVIRALNDTKTELMNEGKSTDAYHQGRVCPKEKVQGSGKKGLLLS